MKPHPPLYSIRENVPKKIDPPEHTKQATHEDVAALMTRWQFERTKYPGWLIAPEGKRMTVWHSTSDWSRDLVKNVAGLPPADRLLVYRELNWRFEISMVPLFPEQIEPFRTAIAESFDALAGGQSVQGVSSWLLPGHNGIQEVLQSWFEIAFGLLREARETYNSDYWASLDSKISQLISGNEQYVDRHQYERALWQIWNVEREAAKSILATWQPSSEKPLAIIWKAGLLAELNELPEARDLLSRTFPDIRKAEQLQGQNIELFSLEGWCTYLLAAVEWCIDFRNGVLFKREFLERWQELKSWDCDPFETKASLEHALSRTPPKMPGQRELIHGFDPGYVSYSYNFPAGVYAYLPAFAYIRFFEQAGVPMVLPMISIAGDELKTACQWISSFIPFWSPALLIRANRVKDLKDDPTLLSRTQIALMNAELTQQLYIWSSNIWDRETTGLAVSGITRLDKDSLLCCLAEVLSRLSFRLNYEQLKQSFVRALAIQPWCPHQAFQLHEAIRNWFARLFEAADEDLLIEWLPELLRAPLVQCINAPEDEWTDAMEQFPYQRIAAREISSEIQAQINEAAELLLERAMNETGAARNRSILRLLRLYGAKTLDKDKFESFAQVLWLERCDNGLPAVPWLDWSSFSALPSPSNVDVVSIIRENILALNPMKGGAITCHDNGSVGLAFPGEPVSDQIFQAAANTKIVFHVLGEAEGAITWTKEEAELLYSGARKWWNQAKQACVKETGVIVIDKTKLGDLIARFLIRVVIPFFSDADHTKWNELLEWIAEMRTLGVYVSQALPYIIALRPDDSTRYIDQMLQDLNGTDNGAIGAACDAVRHFVVLHRAGKIAANSSQLVTALVARVAFRRQIALHLCLVRLTQLIAQRTDALDRSQTAELAASLTAWLEHLALSPDSSREFSTADLPGFRRQVGVLAGVLAALYSLAREPEPESIATWRTACATDTMPEVRRAFGDGELFFVGQQRT